MKISRHMDTIPSRNKRILYKYCIILAFAYGENGD